MEDRSFEELFNESLKEENTLEKTVTGKIINITKKGEIFVDLGYKSDGLITKEEYSYDENKNPNDEFKIGDEITADVIRKNDELGSVFLSYKRYKRREEAKKEKELRIKQAKERQLKKQEIEKQKAEKARNIEEFWDNLKIGTKYTGTISKILDYGLFVDLGLVTGLLHISEISWDKEVKLNDEFNIGDEIDVKIKSFNRDDKKISLEYPLKGENPWYAAIEKYNITDIVTGKITKFAPFGAFVEIEKGVEGLVHISEITGQKRITKPEEVLALGQTVNAKIIDINKEKCKIGLSIRELEGTSREYGYENYINNKT